MGHVVAYTSTEDSLYAEILIGGERAYSIVNETRFDGGERIIWRGSRISSGGRTSMGMDRERARAFVNAGIRALEIAAELDALHPEGSECTP